MFKRNLKMTLMTNKEKQSVKVPQLIFLFYVNRSGSTYLSSLLDSINAIGVSIEGPFLGRLVWENAELRSDKDIESLVQTIMADPQSSSWEPDPKKIYDCLKRLPKPADTQTIFIAILQHCISKKDIDYIVVKGSGLHFLVPRLRRMFHNPKFLHIFRDPRATYGSQTRATSVNIGTPMASDPIVATKRWLRTIEYFEKIPNDDLLKIRFEDLLNDVSGKMNEVCDFINTQGLAPLSFDPESSSGGYFDKIPDEQKNLHKKVKKGKAETGRTEAWRNEVSEMDIHLIQKKAGHEMVRLGYELIEIDPKAKSPMKVAKYLFKIGIYSIKYALQRYVVYLSNPYLLRERIIAKYQEIKHPQS